MVYVKRVPVAAGEAQLVVVVPVLQSSGLLSV
jgi:hypothetical protein